MNDLRPAMFRAGPPRASQIRLPGLAPFAGGAERTVVPGGGMAVMPVAAGDRLRITNSEGGQRCELLAADSDGRIDMAVLGTVGDTDAAGIRALLTSDQASLKRLRGRLAARGIGLEGAKGAGLFGADSPAGDHQEFTATRDGLVIVAAPGNAMSPWDQDTLSPLTVVITRAARQGKLRRPLPEPLADPGLDLRVASATARAYRVKAGDYIQIIDIDGRQCTDFQAFDARKLDQGITHPLDMTTTRTLQGRDYAMPGLHGKFFDQDMVPLIEVVQDTCGRHDAFAMACAAKYYDDIGYPGHPNCSTNFNGALADYGAEQRPGWMAMNFFFNTRIDEHGVMYIDEPWSRPGDYVLMRALTDLVCVSSACPDDTTPANGWDLTDIHVRTYDGAEKFQRATAWRATPEAMPIMTRETPFHDSFAALTRDFVEYKGFWLPNSFPSVGTLGEYWACREKAVVMDLSPLRKFEVTGPDAEALMNHAVTRDMEKLAQGQVVYTAMCYPHGGMLDDGTVFRLGRDNFRWIGGSDLGGEHLRELADQLGLKVMIRSSTDQLGNLAVQGPASREILSQIVWTAPHQTAFGELEWFRFTVARIGGPSGPPVVVSRTGYTGELGYEVFCHPKDAKEVFDAIWQAGEPFGMQPMGLAALDMVRIESGLIFAGYDFSDQTDPFEAGIGFTVPLKSKAADFVGREALQRRKDHPSHRFVGLEIDGNLDVGHGDGIYLGRAQVGVVTSSTRSPILSKNVALARVDIAHAAPGTELEVGKLDGAQKRLPAKIVPLSFYDPQKTKPRS
ncbi:DUF1989 domain-containing protein [Paracoccus pacificus]|uniref:DUF1989 domain-containing protein n=1 Tax=Paracoccus pacificus TaxID=1463598 RepID=A0ABW4R733_9RHOB